MAGVLIFRSGKLFDADLIAAAFEENGIPFYRRTDAGGVERAMPVAPSQFFGIFWSIYVPAEMEAAARSIIEASLVDTGTRSNWEPSAAEVRRWHYFVAAAAAGGAIIIYMRCFAR